MARKIEVEISKRFFQCVLINCLVLCLTLCGPVPAYSVCSSGISEPPFLSLGVRSNLLLLFDNSGSMLDMAYTDPDGTQCFDDSFDPNNIYAGYFDQSTWYEWNSGPYSPWESAKGYGGAGQPERVYVNGIIYEVQGACTSIGNFLGDDSGCTWDKLIDFDSYQLNTSYTTDSFVFDGGQVYQPQSNCTSSGSNLVSDIGCIWDPVDHTWRKNTSYNIGDIVTYKGMYFEVSSGGTSSSTSLDDDTGIAWAYLGEGDFVKVAVSNIATHCGSAAGTAQGNSDLCVSVDTTPTPDQVTAFVVRGNLLNWAMSSKFDIQKKILTGGKYDAERDFLVSESRGCAGTGYVKQVLLDNGDYFTMRVRGAVNKGEPLTWDQVDSTDDTTRLEILGVSSSGFNMGACQDAVDKIMTVGSGFQSDVDACLSGVGVADDARSALNHAMSYCWGDTTVRINTIGQNFTDCEAIYSSMQSSSIASYHDAYNCYGVYDETKNHEDRMGYVGRCWQYSGSNCYPKPATGDCAGDPCTYQPGGVNTNLFKNAGGYNYLCSKLKSDGVQCQNDGAFELLYTDASDGSGASCIPASTGVSDWTENLDGDPSNDPDLTLIDNTVIKNTLPGVEDAQWWCVYQAMEDFCGDLNIPEVIDPSDQATSTSSYWNIPATLVDSGVMSQLGIDHPLIVMKGYLKDSTQPQGILHDVASELRIGVMAFNDVGAYTECLGANLTDAIQEYCPATNEDGAYIKSEIKLGSENTGIQTHVEDVADAINTTRATSWTPLAEAMYNAIRYYTQNTGMAQLNSDDDGTISTDPVTNWCQENHILIITEGASTADINQKVIDFVDAAGIAGFADADSAADTKCTDGLQGSTYLDDLTYFAQHADAGILYPAGNSQLPSDDGTMMDKKNITTNIVVTGTLRDKDDTECSPDELIREAASNGGTALMVSASPSELERNLLEVFNSLRQRASAGSAASVISSARGGEGAIYQAIFWPELTRQDNASNDWAVSWVGDVHALFIDEYGYMYEDTVADRTLDTTSYEDIDGDGHLDVDEDVNNNGIFDLGEDIDGDGHLDVAEDVNGNGVIDGDRRIIIYFDNSLGLSMACPNTSIYDTGVCNNPVKLADVKFVWSANDWLSRISNSAYPLPSYAWDDIYYNRDTYISNEPRRHIFTWIDLDNDGVVDNASEALPFVDRDSFGTAFDWSALAVSNRGSVTRDFNAVDNTEVRKIIRWVRGDDWIGEDLNHNNFLDPDEDIDGDGNLDVFEDSNGNGVLDPGEDTDGDGSLESPVRRRQLPASDGNSTFTTWRLGDIIHSTPMTVSAPAEAYHLIYNDRSYAKFFSHYKNRRHVVYFGANDGMIHAVNAGFFSEKKFCLDQSCTGVGPELGAELWAYVPYNLLPHLKCLMDKGYSQKKHKYYVDLRPRIFDVKIFTADADHPEGWGTILVGGMRFGGAPVDAHADLGQPNNDNRKFISSYFILDITNPEKEPVLLGELTQTLSDTSDPASVNFVDLGYSTVIPAMVTMKDTTSSTNEWYLIFGSGPHGTDALKGVSDQNAKISVLALSDLVDGMNKPKKTLRLSAALPVSGSPDGTFELADSPQGFISDPITVDFDINPTIANHKTDAIYFGTVEGDFDGTSTFWDGGGHLYRLVTRELDILGQSVYGSDTTEPSATTPESWELKPLLNLSDTSSVAGNPRQAITASPTVGTDGYNFWVYFGTGRFFDAIDKTDTTQQTYYGIKEPMTWSSPTEGTFLWEEVELQGSGSSPGDKGLLKVDEILVQESASVDSDLSCRGGGALCLPADLAVPTFKSLIKYTSGTKDCSSTPGNNCVDGWYKDFYPYNNRERNVGQATLLGGLLTYTTYQPYNDACLAEGLAYLYADYYQTGTAWHERIFGDNGIDSDGNVKDKLDLGRGLAVTPNLHVGAGDGEGKGPKVFIQTSTGEIKEIKQLNLPYEIRPGMYKWKEWTR